MRHGFPDLVRLFDDLPAPTTAEGSGRFCAHPIAGHPACTVGKDAGGHPVLLVRAAGMQLANGPPLALQHISVIHAVRCRLRDPSNTAEEERTLSVIRCSNADRDFHEYFLRSLHPVIASLPASPSTHQIAEAIERLVSLFRQMGEPPRRQAAGLWAELFLMARSRGPEQLLSCWHPSPEERFDFAFGPDRLEVKAASGRLRQHYFSLEQLRPPEGANVVIASILLEPSGGGASLADLIDQIRSRVTDPGLLIRLDQVVAASIGQEWRALRDVRFDMQLAGESAWLVGADAVPSVTTPLPPEVSEVRFRVDLSQHPLPLPEAFIEASALFRSAVPHRG